MFLVSMGLVGFVGGWVEQVELRVFAFVLYGALPEHKCGQWL